MSIGATIKKMRRERDMTQESLAEYLGISVGAVSQWECGRTSPDISQLPALANVFDVSVDEILGVDQTKSAARIEEIVERANDLYFKCDFDGAAKIAREGQKKYPRSYYLMVTLADYVPGLKPEESIELCEKVIAECADTALKHEAIRIIVSDYDLLGRKDQAVRYVDMMPPASSSKEDLLMNLLEGDESFENLRDYAKFCTGRLFVILSKLTKMKDRYSEEERVKLCSQRIRIGKAIYCDGDYNYSADLMANAYGDLAQIYAERGDRDGALSCLKSESEFRKKFDTYDETAANTSPAVKGYVDGGWLRADGESSVGKLIEKMETDETFAFIRDDPEFKSILDGLRS